MKHLDPLSLKMPKNSSDPLNPGLNSGAIDAFMDCHVQPLTHSHISLARAIKQ